MDDNLSDISLKEILLFRKMKGKGEGGRGKGLSFVGGSVACCLFLRNV